MADITFIDGMTWQEPHKNAPTWVKGGIIIDLNKFWKFADKNQGKAGFLTLQIAESKKGNIYLSLNNYKKPEAVAPADNIPMVQIEPEDVYNDIPF